MAVAEQLVTDRYALYQGDCIEVGASLPDASIDFSLYSPPFAGLYHYSSSDRDLSNNPDYASFMAHYAFVVRDIHRLTKPGRLTGVHCMDVPSGNSGLDYLVDFPGDIIRLHEREGWRYVARYAVWKEPFAVRMRTLMKGLAHQTIVQDSSRCTNAAADYLLVFRRSGDNATPIAHASGLTSYAGERQPPSDVLEYKGWNGKQTENRYSHWIWRQYASAFWDDVRPDRVLPFRPSKEDEDEKHVHPLQLDVIERAVTLWSNPNDIVYTPFMGVGSECYGALLCGRRTVGVELKASYYRQAIKNIQSVKADQMATDTPLFAAIDMDAVDDTPSLADF